MKQLLITRHGRTEWNRRGLFRGRVDIPLDETGVQQAARLAEYCRRFKIDLIYTSPLARAQATAEAVARAQAATVAVAPALTDFDYGAWTGQPRDLVRARYPALYARWLRTPQLARMPGGEALGDVTRRTRPLLKEMTLGEAGVVLIVTHQVVCQAIICQLLGLSNARFWNIAFDSCALSIFDYDQAYDRLTLSRHNDTSFLRDEAAAEAGRT